MIRSALGSHMLRQALHSLDTLELLRAADARGPAIPTLDDLRAAAGMGWRPCAAACLRVTQGDAATGAGRASARGRSR